MTDIIFQEIVSTLTKQRTKGGALMYFYQRLRDLREDHDLSQGNIAELLQVAQQHYSMYETGKRELPMHHFVTLAKFYNVSLDYLAGLTNTPKKLYEDK